MKYIIELDNEIFQYMKAKSGTVEKYFKKEVITPIIKELKQEEFRKIREKEQKQVETKLNEMQKTVNIKLDRREL